MRSLAAVERIVQDRFVGAPAVGIVVDMLLNLEGRALLLHLHAEHDVQVLGLRQFLLVHAGKLGVVGILHEVAAMLPVAVAHAEIDKRLVHIVLHEVLAGEVNHRTCIACLVDDEEAGDACILCYLGVVGTKCGSDVYNTGTILSRDIIAWNDAESFFTLVGNFAVLEGTRLHPWEELLVLHANEVSTFASPNNLEFLAFLSLEVS